MGLGLPRSRFPDKRIDGCPDTCRSAYLSQLNPPRRLESGGKTSYLSPMLLVGLLLLGYLYYRVLSNRESTGI